MNFNLEIPEDLEPYMRHFQGKMKEKRQTSFYSLTKCIIAMMREHKEWSEKAEKDRGSEAPGDRLLT